MFASALLVILPLLALPASAGPCRPVARQEPSGGGGAHDGSDQPKVRHDALIMWNQTLPAPVDGKVCLTAIAKEDKIAEGAAVQFNKCESTKIDTASAPQKWNVPFYLKPTGPTSVSYPPGPITLPLSEGEGVGCLTMAQDGVDDGQEQGGPAFPLTLQKCDGSERQTFELTGNYIHPKLPAPSPPNSTEWHSSTPKYCMDLDEKGEVQADSGWVRNARIKECYRLEFDGPGSRIPQSQGKFVLPGIWLFEGRTGDT